MLHYWVQNYNIDVTLLSINIDWVILPRHWTNSTHLRRQTRYCHYVKIVRLVVLSPSSPSRLKEQKPHFKRILRESPKLLVNFMLRIRTKPSRDRILSTRGNSGDPESFTAIDLARNHLQDSLVSFPCSQPRRSFTPQRHLIGCTP